MLKATSSGNDKALTLSLVQTTMPLVATRQGVVLVSCHLTAREGFDPSIDPLLHSVLCDVFKMAKWIGYSLVWRNIKRIPPKSVNPKGNQPRIFIGRTDATAETPILWPPDAKNQLIGKDPEAGKDWGQEEKGITEDEKVEWHHQLNGHEFEQTPAEG